MKKLIQANPLIAFSILLPLLIVILFSLVTWLPRVYVDAPVHDFVFIDESYQTNRDAQVSINFSVADNKIVARIVEPKRDNRGTVPRLYIFEHRKQTIREVDIPLPSNSAELLGRDTLEIPSLSKLSIDDALLAPDGYEYIGQARNGGFITEMFGGNQSRSTITIAKDGAMVRIKLPKSRSWYANVRFLGWVT